MECAATAQPARKQILPRYHKPQGSHLQMKLEFGSVPELPLTWGIGAHAGTTICIYQCVCSKQ